MARYNHSPEKPRNAQFATMNLLMGGLVRALELGAQEQARAQEMEKAAMIDPLTGVHNRRYLEQTWDKMQASQAEKQRAQDSNRKTAGQNSLILIDLDNFKSINDRFGHDRGDEVLKQASAIFTSRMRERDPVIRMGGDEFAILLPRTSEDQAAIIGCQLLERANEAGIEMSVGVAEANIEEPLGCNLENVDHALYEAKNRGRNQVYQYSDLAGVA
jgi:diguanylate cyclase (GGDEF)-like protein